MIFGGATASPSFHLRRDAGRFLRYLAARPRAGEGPESHPMQPSSELRSVQIRLDFVGVESGQKQPLTEIRLADTLMVGRGFPLNSRGHELSPRQMTTTSYSASNV